MITFTNDRCHCSEIFKPQYLKGWYVLVNHGQFVNFGVYPITKVSGDNEMVEIDTKLGKFWVQVINCKVIQI